MRVKPAKRTESVQEYYFSRKLRQIDELRKGGADIINLGIGSPDQAPSANVIEALSSEAGKLNVHGYQSYTGIPELRSAFAQWYSEYFKVTLDPSKEILPLMGSKEGIMHISQAFVNPGEEVLVPDPGYPTYTSVTNLTGGKVRTYNLTEKNKWQPDFKEIEDTSLENVKLMWVNYPHMPTGAKGSVRLYEKLIRFASDNNILICNDNPYSFILNNDYLSILAVDGAKEFALELNSLSKSHNMAGWRIGMVAGDEGYINDILKVKSNMDSGMFRAMQVAAVEALRNPRSWFETVNRTYMSRRIIVEEIMDLLGCHFDREQSGLFLWGRLPDKASDAENFTDDILMNAHVFITPGFIFGNNGKQYIRISLCADEKRLSEAKNRIASYTKR